MPDQSKVAISVPSEDPKKKKKPEEEEKDDKKPGSSTQKDGKGTGSKDDKEGDGDELSEEDLQLKGELEMLAERLKESNKDLYRPALETLRTLIRTSTSSMTSVPKPLKFLRPLYPDLQILFDSWDSSEDKSLFADILSVLAMTYSDTQPRGTLRYRLLSSAILNSITSTTSTSSLTPVTDPGTWGHEYVRHLAAELGEEFTVREQSGSTEPAPQSTTDPAAASLTTTANGIPPATNGKEKTEAEKKAEEEALAKLAEKPLPIGTLEELGAIALECAKFLLTHNAEPDAVDLLAELEMIRSIVDLVDLKPAEDRSALNEPGVDTYSRVCQYMLRCVSYLVPPDDVVFLETIHTIYVRRSKFPEALAVAIRLGDKELIKSDFEAPANPVMRKQLAFILARAQTPLTWLSNEDGEEDELGLDETLLSCLGNEHLSRHFKAFGKELGVAEAKSLEDIYKSHLENSRAGAAANVDSARGNLAGTFVNAFVNAGYGNDKLVTLAEQGSSWIYKNKDYGMFSASASVGLCSLWDPEMGMTPIDSHSYSSEELVKAGTYLATGIVNSGIRSEIDAPLALLSDAISNPSVPIRTSAINGLGIAYAGSHREDVMGLLLPLVADDDLSMEVSAVAALAVGFIGVGSENGEATETILQTIMERAEKGDEDKSLNDKWAKLMIVGLGLLYLGLQGKSDAAIETLKVINHPISKTALVIVDACAHAGTGNVLKVQEMMHYCDDHIVPKKDDDAKDKGKEKESETPAAPGAGAAAVPAPGSPPGSTAASSGSENKEEEKEKESAEPQDDTFQAFAVLGVALIAMGEEIGAEMSLRQLNHLMQYGEPVIRRTVPLALGLVSVSNPVLPILDTLSKYSHDNDLSVALNAIFAMGLVGAGTNNARLAQLLRQLAGYYYKEADCLFMVRIAQGLVHMGKGTIGLSPFYADRTIMSRPAVAGLLATLTAFTDAKSFILDKAHYMLFYLAPAMYPRFLIALDENLEPLPVTVRVGQAVDVVGQAGKPRTISGFQTHQAPVRLGTTERAELATEEYHPFSNNLEGFVLLQKNAGWETEEKMEL